MCPSDPIPPVPPAPPAPEHYGELVRVWEAGAFRLELYDPNRRRHDHKWQLCYRFFDSRVGPGAVFDGTDYGCAPSHAVDSDAAVGALLSFLSLKPGDTDDEFFDGYTEHQIEWRDQYAEELQMEAIYLEEGADGNRD